MAIVNSVLGPLDTADMGFTLCHEHVAVTMAGLRQVYPEFIDRQDTISRAAALLREAYSEGVRTMVDMTVIDLGRDVSLLEEVSRRSGVNIICATGAWLESPRPLRMAPPDTIASLYVRDIQEGIEGTGIKAGVIKAATDKGGVTPQGESVLRAVARAHKATGAPISTHTWAPERVGEQQVRIFEEEGVDLNRVCIGHSNDTLDTDYLIGLMKKGAWVGLDRFPGGREDYPGTPEWEERTETIKKLIDAGYAHRIVLSHDWYMTLSPASQEFREGRHRYNPDAYLFISRNVLPRLRKMDVSEETIDRIMVDNPRRFFEGG